MTGQFTESWAQILLAAEKLRDFGWGLGGPKMEKLTLAQARILRKVFHHSPQGIMLKDIAKEVNLTAGAVSQTIDMLVKEGLVERVNNANDRRAVTIRVSPECQAIRSYVLNIFDQMMASVQEKTTPAECDAFMKVLDLLMDNIAENGESDQHYSKTDILNRAL